ncbi:hypothetical protein ARTHRO9AX_80472 [Arthrobacter sp. 9AX]|nr:hypothetical protein ARTHRO9AX_80472 [Arthrobacter sp. 9AX]
MSAHPNTLGAGSISRRTNIEKYYTSKTFPRDRDPREIKGSKALCYLFPALVWHISRVWGRRHDRLPPAEP